MITRFAPSPTGPLHLGHAYSAICAHDLAMTAGGQFLLRIEDIDQSRARPKWEDLIYKDLSWLGLNWPEPVLRQSDRMPAYAAALDRLWALGVLYPCHCSRRDIQSAISAPQEGAPMGPDGVIYPGTCRNLPKPGQRPTDCALRLNMAMVASPVQFTDTGLGQTYTTSTQVLIDDIGDVVLARREMGTSYHLSVVLDDAAQQITHVVRGEDLRPATPIHIILQKTLDLPTPVYHHHRLIRDETGKRLAKRDDARAISNYRADGATPADIRRWVGLAAG